MDVNDFLLDVSDVDWSRTLSPWLFLVPGEMTIWLVNRFGDLFAVLDDDSIHMLDVGGGTFERVANSRDDFCNMLELDDNANHWLMIPLIDKLVVAGKRLQNGYCYDYL